MKKREYILPLSILALFFGILLSACSSSVPTASSTIDASLLGSNQVVRVSLSKEDQGSPDASEQGNSYAFVRNEQLWVALNGAKPVQVTHFDYGSVGGDHANVFWNQPLWFDGDHYVAFELKALLGGLGGGGCGFIGNYARTSGLYVLNTRTQQITKIDVPGEKGPATESPYDGYWEQVFMEDPTHLLAWHFVTNKLGGLYRYDFGTGSLSLVLPASQVPDADSNPEAFFPMRYSNGQLYYEVMNNVFGSVYDHVIYRHSITYPNKPTMKVLDAGAHTFCDMATGNTGTFREPGWDISPDGQHLVVQKIVKSPQGKETSTIQSISLRTGAVIQLFPQLSATDLAHDLVLSWAPDSRTLVLQASAQTPGQGTFYSTALEEADQVQSYAYKTNFEYQAGHISWKPDSTAFTFSAFQNVDKVVSTDVYAFTIGKAQGSVLLSNATNFAWS